METVTLNTNTGELEDVQADVDTTGTGEGEQEASAASETQAKTFTQEEVSKMLAKEKRQGRQAVLRAMGLDPSEKGVEERVKGVLDAQKTDVEKAETALKLAETAARDAEVRAEIAECKLKVIMAGCNNDAIDDVILLATGKVNDDTDFSKALAEVKKKYPAMFGGVAGGSTGEGISHRRTSTSSKPGSFGARLAENSVKGIESKNPYFKD